MVVSEWKIRAHGPLGMHLKRLDAVALRVQ